MMENVVVIFVTRVLQYYKDEEVGEDRGLRTQEKRRGLGEKRAVFGSSKRQGTMEAEEIKGIN